MAFVVNLCCINKDDLNFKKIQKSKIPLSQFLLLLTTFSKNATVHAVFVFIYFLTMYLCVFVNN